MKIRNGSFPMEWDEQENRLYVNGEKLEPAVRTIGDMDEVLYDRKFAAAADKSKILYYMHRNVHKKEDEPALEKFRRRYDVTVIPPAMLGEEYVKTIGHYHELSPKGISFPELYEVMAGTAHFLIFKRKKNALAKAGSGVGMAQDTDDKITDAILIEAKAGEKVFVPPDYGHVMINPGKEILATNNIVEWKFKSLYEPVGKMKGAPYFELAGEKTVPNGNFSELSPLTNVGASNYQPTLDLKMNPKKAVYDLFVENPGSFGFLEP